MSCDYCTFLCKMYFFYFILSLNSKSSPCFHVYFKQKGNIFLCDYKHLDGVKTNTINGKKQYLMAPLVLLQKTADKKLMPIAIQVRSTQMQRSKEIF